MKEIYELTDFKTGYPKAMEFITKNIPEAYEFCQAFVTEDNSRLLVALMHESTEETCNIEFDLTEKNTPAVEFEQD